MTLIVVYEELEFLESFDTRDEAIAACNKWKRLLQTLDKWPEFNISTRQVDRYGAIGVFLMLRKEVR